jgi:hypothetical protein
VPPITPVVSFVQTHGIYIRNKTHPVHYDTKPLFTASCISNRHPARRLPHRLQSRYPLVSRLAGWLHPLDPSAVSTRSNHPQVAVPRARTHHGPPALRWATATPPRPSSRTKTSLVVTLTTTLPVPTSPRRLHRPVSPLWPRHSPSFRHCTRRRSPRVSAGAAVARSSVAPPSP